MSELAIIVCVKVVPKPEEIRVNPENNRLVRKNARSEINPPDMNALEVALQLKDQFGGKVFILSMGPPLFKKPLRTCLAMGADHIYLLSDPAFGGADTLATTYTLAKAIEKIGDASLVICGEESSDGATGQVPPGLAEWLVFNQITMVDKIMLNAATAMVQGTRKIRGGHEMLEVPMPAVISVKTASNEPRFINFQIKDWAFEEEQLTVWQKNDLDVDADMIGEPGSPTVVSGLAEAPFRERKRIFLDGAPNDLIRQVVEIVVGVAR
ncbi:MAG: electron transfer flavoprotein subunit beta/FixA family protein [Anaerolineales bacterium]|jgi:electron transfer flavoprotein beta subunit